MHNIGDDNELDRLSREAAWKYDVPGEANWQKMELELDKVLPVQKDRKKPLLLWWLLPILLLGGASYWWLENKNDAGVATQKKETETAGKMITSDKMQASATENSAIVQNKNSGVEKNTVPGASAEKKILSAKSPVTPGILLQKSMKNSFPNTQFSLVTKQQRADANSAKTTVVAGVSNPVEQPQTNKVVVVDQKNAVETPKEITGKINFDSPATARMEVAKEINLVTNPEQVVEPMAKTAPYQTQLMPAAKGKGWSYALLAGFDKSTVKFKYGNDPGLNIGLLAGYHFNSRLSLHTGAIYTQKNYKLAGEDFTPPKGSWLNNYKLENVKGYCRMWEVPLLARYMVNNQAKNNVFISTGLSSYFMTREKYSYFFYNAGAPTTRTTSYNSTDTHILSIAHLSAGFESPLNRNLSLQIEPYAKIPLDGVGLGNIRLSSFGINLAVQYRQPAKK